MSKHARYLQSDAALAAHVKTEHFVAGSAFDLAAALAAPEVEVKDNEDKTDKVVTYKELELSEALRKKLLLLDLVTFSADNAGTSYRAAALPEFRFSDVWGLKRSLVYLAVEKVVEQDATYTAPTAVGEIKTMQDYIAW